MVAGYDKPLGTIGKWLRVESEDITHVPLPRRWVDLIHHLDEQERKSLAQTQREAEPGARQAPRKV